MKDVPVSYKKGLLAGLRPDSKMGRGTENLVTCVGVYPKAGSLSDLEDETFIDVSSLACTFPYPQYFELSGCTLVCTPTAIYSYSSGVLTEEISGLTADNLWTLADFNSYIFLTNGTETVIRNPETGEFIAINNQETPPAECVCGTPSQIIYGGPDMTMLDMGIVPYNDAIPPSVDSFTVTYCLTYVAITWSMKEVVSDLKGFRIRYARGLAATYDQMTALHSGLYSPTTTSASITLDLAGTYSFAIVAVDKADQESIPVYRELVCGLLNYKMLGWPGVRGTYNAVDADGNLAAIDETSLFWNSFSTWASASWDTTYSVVGDISYTSAAYDLGHYVIGKFSFTFSAASGYEGFTLSSQAIVRLLGSVDGVTYSAAFLYFLGTSYSPIMAARYVKVEVAINNPAGGLTSAYLKLTGAQLEITRA